MANNTNYKNPFQQYNLFKGGLTQPTSTYNVMNNDALFGYGSIANTNTNGNGLYNLFTGLGNPQYRRQYLQQQTGGSIYGNAPAPVAAAPVNSGLLNAGNAITTPANSIDSAYTPFNAQEANSFIDANIVSEPSDSFFGTTLNSTLGTDGGVTSALPTGEKTPFNWSGLASGIADVTNAGVGVGQLLLGYKNYQQAKKQFEFEKGLLNRNVKNQATQINNQMDAATNIAAQLNRKAGMTSADYQAARDTMYENTKKRHVDGSPVG